MQLWSPFPSIEQIPGVHAETMDDIQSVILYNKNGTLVEYYYGNNPQFR